MPITPELVTAIGGVAIALLTWWRSAKKGDLENLRQIIASQAATIDRLQSRVDALELENDHYQRLLARHGIDPNTETSPPPNRRDTWGKL